MRRISLAVALTVTVLGAAACGGDGDETSAGASPSVTSASPAASPTPSLTPTASANYAADTKRICTEIEKSLETDMEKFGVEVGKMIGYKQAGNTARANQAKADAQAELRAIASGVRERTAVAQDPELREAGQESAENMEASAADEAFFSRLRTPDDLKQVAVSWILPLAELCA
jgi:hypothetical protein